jgi:hypothetical protein
MFIVPFTELALDGYLAGNSWGLSIEGGTA